MHSREECDVYIYKVFLGSYTKYIVFTVLLKSLVVDSISESIILLIVVTKSKVALPIGDV